MVGGISLPVDSVEEGATSNETRKLLKDEEAGNGKQEIRDDG